MRSVCLAILLVAISISVATAAEIRVISPGVISNSGLRENATNFTKATGINVIIVPAGMGEIINQVKTATPPADIVMLPMNLMGGLALEKGIQDGTFTPLGRAELGLFVKPDATHPDISTVEKFAAALRTASVVMYTNPQSGSMQAGIADRLLQRPEFAGVKSMKIKGDAEPALKRGDGDARAMGLGLVHDDPRDPKRANRYLVGPLPAELDAYMDMATAISSRSTNTKDAAAFIRFITQPEATPVWKSKGILRY
ncbi:MAG: substrate-binding domain-containing protein [Candidatus Korobacteraceae bacterium]